MDGQPTLMASLVPPPRNGQAIPVHSGPCPVTVDPAPALEYSCALDGAEPAIWLLRGEPRHALFHELGHVFDFERTDRFRRRFMAIAGIPSAPWETGPNAPRERFAEAYALCSRFSYFGPGLGEDYQTLNWLPSTRTHRRVCALIKSASGRSPSRRTGSAR